MTEWVTLVTRNLCMKSISCMPSIKIFLHSLLLLAMCGTLSGCDGTCKCTKDSNPPHLWDTIRHGLSARSITLIISFFCIMLGLRPALCPLPPSLVVCRTSFRVRTLRRKRRYGFAPCRFSRSRRKRKRRAVCGPATSAGMVDLPPRSVSTLGCYHLPALIRSCISIMICAASCVRNLAHAVSDTLAARCNPSLWLPRRATKGRPHAFIRTRPTRTAWCHPELSVRRKMSLLVLVPGFLCWGFPEFFPLTDFSPWCGVAPFLRPDPFFEFVPFGEALNPGPFPTDSQQDRLVIGTANPTTLLGKEPDVCLWGLRFLRNCRHGRSPIHHCL